MVLLASLLRWFKIVAILRASTMSVLLKQKRVKGDIGIVSSLKIFI